MKTTKTTLVNLTSSALWGLTSILSISLIAGGCTAEVGSEDVGGEQIDVAELPFVSAPVVLESPPATCECVRAPCACQPQVRSCEGSALTTSLDRTKARALVAAAKLNGKSCAFEPTPLHFSNYQQVNASYFRAQPPEFAWVCEGLCRAIATHALTGSMSNGGTMHDELGAMLGMEFLRGGWVHTADENGADIYLNQQTGQYVEYSHEEGAGQTNWEIIYNDGRVITYQAESYASSSTSFAIK